LLVSSLLKLEFLSLKTTTVKTYKKCNILKKPCSKKFKSREPLVTSLRKNGKCAALPQ
jgi:hypothetical protein